MPQVLKLSRELSHVYGAISRKTRELRKADESVVTTDRSRVTPDLTPEYFDFVTTELNKIAPQPLTTKDIDPDVYRAVMYEVLYVIFNRDRKAAEDFFMASNQHQLALLLSGYTLTRFTRTSMQMYVQYPHMTINNPAYPGTYVARAKDVKTDGDTAERSTHTNRSRTPRAVRPVKEQRPKSTGDKRTKGKAASAKNEAASAKNEAKSSKPAAKPKKTKDTNPLKAWGDTCDDDCEGADRADV